LRLGVSKSLSAIATGTTSSSLLEASNPVECVCLPLLSSRLFHIADDIIVVGAIARHGDIPHESVRDGSNPLLTGRRDQSGQPRMLQVLGMEADHEDLGYGSESRTKCTQSTRRGDLRDRCRTVSNSLCSLYSPDYEQILLNHAQATYGSEIPSQDESPVHQQW